MPNTPPLAEALLDAQVAWVLGELSGDRLQQLIAHDVEDVLDIAAGVPLSDLITAEDVSRIAARLLEAIPSSTTASTMVQTWTDVAHAGPDEAIAIDAVLSREHAEALVEAALSLHPLVERALDRAIESPMAGTLATRFVTKIVSEVMQANRSVAEKIPGMGSMMNIGTSAASKVMGAADKPLQQLVGDPANRGAAFAARRLNKVVVDTLKDPMLRDALMEVWDQHAAEPLTDTTRVIPREDVQRFAALGQEIVIDAATTPAVLAFVEAFVVSFFDVYGDHPVTVLLDELGIGRAQIIEELQVLLPRAVTAATEDGRLEAAVRSRLRPFFDSPAVHALLTT